MLSVADNVRCFNGEKHEEVGTSFELLRISFGRIYARLTSIEASSKEIACHH